MIHPYHPLFGQEFELETYRRAWSEHRVYYCDERGRMKSLPARWTDVVSEDPFVATSAGRSRFRVDDLLDLADLLKSLQR